MIYLLQKFYFPEGVKEGKSRRFSLDEKKTTGSCILREIKRF